MKKRFCAIILLFVMVLAIPVCAAKETRAPISRPAISFSGTTANCSMIVTADHSNDKISATLELWHGNTLIDSWNNSGNGFLSVKGSAQVLKGNTYKVVGKVKINNTSYSPVEIYGTCK